MLPEFPQITHLLMNRLQLLMRRARDTRTSHMKGARNIVCFEGDRHGGRHQPDQKFREFCDEIMFHKDEIPGLTQQALIEKFEAVGLRIGEEVAKHHFDVIREACESIETVVKDGESEQLIEQVLRMMERVVWSFDENGVPEGMTFFAGPEMAEKLAEANKQIEESPNLLRRKQQIISTKYEEWRATQANRKLVD